MKRWVVIGLVTLLGHSAKAQDLHDAARAVERLDLYEGLEARLFASEPMITSPTNLDVDRRGRVWVCDVQNYREHARKPSRAAGDQILILEDTNGDGVADSKKVYYEGRDVDAALGICVLGNRVIVSCAPNILVFTDDDGDDRPDRKEALFSKTGRKQDDHSTHSVVYGPDGMLYWNFGNNGQAVHDREGNPVNDARGRVVKDAGEPYREGMAFRCRPDGTGLEVLGHNFRNNYELAVDSLGTVWQTDNDDDGNYGCRINYVMEGGNFGYREELTGRGWRERRVNAHAEVSKRHWHQNDPGVVPNFVQTGAGSPTGITVYEGRLLPEVFWDQPLACDAGPGVVWAARATPKGAGFDGELVNLVKGTRDRWFRPVDVAVAPDGAVFVSDWYDPHVGWNRQGDQEHGRIYRIAPVGHRPTVPSLTPIERFVSPNTDMRYGAEPELTVEDCVKLFRESGNMRHRARALWRLAAIKALSDELLAEALGDTNPEIRQVAVRTRPELSVIAELVGDASPRVRRECALALRRFEGKDPARLWAELAVQHGGKDRWYLEALGIGAARWWDQALAALEARRPFAERLDSGGLTLGEEQLLWRSRGAASAGYLAKLLPKAKMDWRWLIRAFDFLPESPAKKRALTELAFDGTEPGPYWLEALLRLDPKDRGHWLAKARLREATVWPGQGDQLGARLAGIEHLEATEVHEDILKWALRHPEHEVASEAVSLGLKGITRGAVRELVVQETDGSRAVVLVGLLGKHQSNEVCEALSGLLLDESKIEIHEAVVQALGQGTRGIQAMVTMAEDGVFPEALKSVAGRAIKSTYNVRVHDRAAKYFPAPAGAGGASELPQMTDLVVYVGDAEKGKAVFTKATCATCHVVHGEGVSFGPDLSVIGEKLSRQGLYEAILNPSASVSPSYQLRELTLKSGEVQAGFVESRGDEALTLRLPGGVLSKVPQAELVEEKAVLVSAMQATLTALMSVGELVDLVAYLEQCREK